jgi:hypothetical protein
MCQGFRRSDTADVSGLDLITFFFAYHDITYMEVDRADDEQEDVRRR